jgi:hypothetical protein
MGGDIITQSTEEKDLGITVDEKLKFQIHINSQTKKANQRLALFHHLYYLLQHTTLYRLQRA